MNMLNFLFMDCCICCHELHVPLFPIPSFPPSLPPYPPPFPLPFRSRVSSLLLSSSSPLWVNFLELWREDWQTPTRTWSDMIYSSILNLVSLSASPPKVVRGWEQSLASVASISNTDCTFLLPVHTLFPCLAKFLPLCNWKAGKEPGKRSSLSLCIFVRLLSTPTLDSACIWKV